MSTTDRPQLRVVRGVPEAGRFAAATRNESPNIRLGVIQPLSNGLVYSGEKAAAR